MAALISYSGAIRHGATGLIAYPQYVDAKVLASGVAETVTVPTGAKIALFSATGNFLVNWLTTAAIPAADVADGSAPEINPVARDISGLSSFSIIAPAACIVAIAYYA